MAVEKERVFIRTKAGEQALADPVRLLQHNLRRLLALVDGRSTVAQISARLKEEETVDASLVELLNLELIVPGPLKSSGASEDTEFDLEDFPAEEDGVKGSEGISGEPATQPAPAPEKPKRRFTWASLKPVGVFPGWRRVLALLSGGAALISSTIIYFYPYEKYIPLVEYRLSMALNQPVKIGGLQVSVLPRPGLSLDRVEIGPSSEMRVAKLRLLPESWDFIDGRASAFQVRLDGVEMAPAGVAVLMLSRPVPASGQPQWSLDRIGFDNLALMLNRGKVAGFSGDLSLGKAGLERVVLRKDGQELRLDLKTEGETLRLKASALDWSLAGVALKGMDMAGTLDARGLNLSRFEAGVWGGQISGRLSLGWSGKMAGNFDLQRLDGGQIWPSLGLDAPLRGETHGRLRVDDAEILDSTTLVWGRTEGDLRSVRGQLAGVDLGAAVRSGNGVAVRGGTTGFDELSLHLLGQGKTWRLSAIQMKAGALQASGDVDIREDNLEGGLKVVLSDKLQTPVSIGGTLKAPVLRGQRKG